MTASFPTPSHSDLAAARELLSDASDELLKHSDFASFLTRLYGRLGAMLGFDCFLHYEPDVSEGHIRLLTHGGLPDQTLAHVSPVAHSDVVCGDVYRSGAPLVLSSTDMASERRMVWARELGLRSYACHPLKVGGTIAGTVAFASAADSLSAETVAVLFALSAQVALAMGHRRIEVEAEAAAKARQTEFISVIAHELRNPLAPIRSGVDIAISDAAGPKEKARAFSMVDRQLTRMARLVDDLLDAARIERGTVRVRLEPIKLFDAVAAAAESVEPALRAKGQTLTIGGDALRTAVMADLIRLSQALANVLNNCAKFTPAGDELSLFAEVRGGLVEIAIRDSGGPIPESDLPGIFKLFAQANRRGAGDGMGIGLALVKPLIELHGGTVAARNRADGLGAEFVIELPLSDTPPDNDDEFLDVERPKAVASQRVLVVDDNEDALESLSLLFELEGKTVRVARDGLSAVAEAEEFRPDFIFMDIGLPEISGIEATRRIRALNLSPRPFIAALTGLGQVADRQATAAAGCDRHLTKPIDIQAALALMSGA